MKLNNKIIHCALSLAERRSDCHEEGVALTIVHDDVMKEKERKSIIIKKI
jgi:hypothetical protein